LLDELHRGISLAAQRALEIAIFDERNARRGCSLRVVRRMYGLGQTGGAACWFGLLIHRVSLICVFAPYRP